MSGHRVLLVEQGGRGGVADYAAALSAALAAAGERVTVLTAADHQYPRAEGVVLRTPFTYVRGHGRAARLARRLGLSRIANGLAYLAALPAVARAARRHDVVHLQGEERPILGLLAMLAVRLAGRPVVYTPHNTFQREGEVGRPRRRQYAEAAAIVVHARADLPALPGSARARAHVIPHGEYGTLARTAVPMGRAEARRTLGLRPDGMVALLFGQLRPDKGVPDALAAVEATPAFQLLVAGRDTGAVLAASADTITRLEQAGRLVVRDAWLEMDEVATAFAAADVALLPYQQASASGVVLLGWGFRVPPVAYPVGGLAEVIEPGVTGWLTDRADPAALARTLGEVAAGGPGACARVGERGEQVMHERFSWAGVARRTVEVYDEVLRRRGSAAGP